MSLEAEHKRMRESLIVQLKAYLAGDGNLWGRMASSHPNAKGVDKPFVMLAEHLRSSGVTADTVEEHINKLPLDLVSTLDDED